MASVKMNYQQLLNVYTDLQNIFNEHPGLNFLFGTQAKHFMQTNILRINTAIDTMNALLKKHVNTNENGEPIKINKADGSFEYSWCLPASKKQYEKEKEDFLSISFDVYR